MTKEEKFINSDGKPKAEQMPRERSSRQRMQKKDKVKPLTKVIIRHLPPTMTEEEFLKQIDPLPEHDFYYYATADWSLGYDATCRAYLNFKNYEDVFLFRDRFDGYVFVDSNGAEYIAIVEFAPFQGLAKNKSRKTDPKVNSIELEPHYKNFLEKLQEEREAATKGGGESKLEFTLDRKKEEKITSTPLLQYLANKKEKRREESKRRTEEKRRQREEEKERRQRNQQQHVTKIMSSQEGGGGGGGGGSKKDNGGGGKSGGGTGGGGGKENSNEPNEHGGGEENKNSRTKRRAARDQRRREEYEQRKRERERLEREQREKGGGGGGGKGAEGSNREKQDNQNSGSKKQDKENKPNDGKSENSNRKDVKKYSERRERDRKRNRKENQEQRQAAPKEEPVVIAAKPMGDVDVASLSKPDAAEVSDSVKNFIRSVAAVKEFVPKHKQKDAEQNQIGNTSKKETSPIDNKAEVQPSKDIEKKPTTENQDKRNDEPAGAAQPKMENAAALEEQQMQKQRLVEERRIRNKDRPSIAIYQPKARLRLSEESDSKDATVRETTRSNPTSDCESLKKEEHHHQTVKKPSRYSERRSERRSKDKRKDSVTSEGNAEHKPELKSTKSQEDSSDVGERAEVKEGVAANA